MSPKDISQHNTMQSQYSDLSVPCPSFSTYSKNSTADTAARISHEFERLGLNTAGDAANDEISEEFEFVSGRDEAFLGGTAGIGKVFPVFNRNLLSVESGGRLGFRGLGEEVSGPPSSSSSDADELDGIPEGTYCVWTPKCTPATPGRCKKSKSTGSTSSSSKRWRLRDLLRRSHSDGKESLVFLGPPAPSTLGSSKKNAVEEAPKPPLVKGRRSSAGKGKDMAAAHELFYARNKTMDRTAEKRRSTFLPYRQDLVGLFANVNTVGRSFPPF